MPLYVFEPRYRAMLKDCLASDGRMAMGLLGEGGFVRPLCGVGRVVRHDPHADGTSHLLLLGESRARIFSTLPTGPYLTAVLEGVEEPCVSGPAAEAARLRLAALLRTIAGKDGRIPLAKLLKGRPGPGALADFAASSFLRRPEQRQEILERLDPLERAARAEFFLKRAWRVVGQAAEMN